MVSEVRRLIFSMLELKSALQLFHTEKKSIFPKGEIVDIALIEDENVYAKVYIALVQSSGGNEVTVDTNTLAAALLFYCKRFQIPIPKGSEKGLAKVGNEVSLNILLTSR
ncbi:hypothetical protein A9Q83_17880 [Alphaproteobacteria bacterium 46_93_T64]|nr:hypothetical protein A9Q83_17880 [Alphaproteobacteria bacterium 46_93_T64]